MVALNENFASDRKARVEQAESAQSSKSVDHPSSAFLHRLRGENRFLFIGRNADAYGNTLIYTGPGTGGVRFTDDDAGSGFTSDANEIIYCGYPDSTDLSKDIGTGLFEPETELYYVRNRTPNPVLGRWLQRDPIGVAGGINLYEYVKGNPILRKDPSGLQVVSLGCPCIPPPINPAAAEAATALLAALAAELDWSWIPDVAFAAAATAAVLLAWEVTCRNLDAAYKAACDDIANYPCYKRMFCDQYPAAISVRVACAAGRAAYLNAGCDVIIPTTKNHPGEMLNAWQAVANCEAASKTCIPRPVCPVTS
jgi:RHS repeat-associated protein